MRINEESILKELRKNTEKNKRVNSYKVNYMKHNGEYEQLTFNQGYDHSTDVYNPFFIRVYDGNGSCIMSGSGSTIENSYNSLVTSLILYMTKAKNDRDLANSKLAEIYGILDFDKDEE